MVSCGAGGTNTRFDWVGNEGKVMSNGDGNDDDIDGGVDDDSVEGSVEGSDDERRADIQAHAQAPGGDAAAEVRQWLLDSRSATLATLSVDARCAGYPFCSIVPFVLDGSGQPIVQVASSAAHTRNMVADARASLMVHEPRTGDPQAGWRVTLVGRMIKLDGDAASEALARIVEHVPRALDYDATHDFSLWRLQLEHVRMIAGFGRIAWIDAATVRRDPLGGGLREQAQGAVEHLNADHADALSLMCTGLAGFAPTSVRAVGIDRTGLMVRASAPDRLVHFSFGREIGAEDVRAEVVKLVRRARAAGSA
jgi:putative heme iron utilization protein